MFNGFQLTPPTPAIQLFTRRGNPIDAEEWPAPSAECLAKWERVLDRHRRTWEVRKRPCGGYNCAGMVWASRRVGIAENAAWELIRADDGYRTLGFGEAPKQGDLAVYFFPEIDPTPRQYIHVAIVMGERPSAIPPHNVNVVYVLSKLDGTLGEALHPAQEFPSPQGSTCEYWTDRPNDQAGLIVRA